MKYAEAVDIGKTCGLEHPAEFVNNIFMHAQNLFTYETICAEEAELLADAKEHGVRFSKVCGDAVLGSDSKDELCYICRKLAACEPKKDGNNK